VLAAATAGPGTAVLVERLADGVTLAEATTAISDETLDSTWESLLALRRARIAHRRLGLGDLIAGTDGSVEITGFTSAVTRATDAQLDADSARVIAATAAAVGPDRAIAAARRHLPPATLLEVLAYLQPPVLPDRTRHALRVEGLRVNAVRDAAASALGVQPPAAAQLERVRWRSIGMTLLTFVGVYVLFGQLGNFTAIRHELADAEWGWFAVALLLAAATNVGYAMSYLGATNAHLPFGRSLLLQAAGSFTNVVTPNAIGTAAINTRFLQVRGERLGSAIASHVVNTLGSGVVQLLLFIAIVPTAGGDFDLNLIPWKSLLTLLVAVGAAAIVAVAVTLRIPQARGWVSSRIRPAVADVTRLIRSPAKATLVIAGNVLVQLLFALSLGAVCRGFGVTVPFSTLLLVNIGSGAIAGLVPAPGGLGVAEATLAGALAAAGVPSAVAVAVTLTQRLVTTWLPPIPGWFALRSLQKRDDL
jgi:undecaprenyl-diphosphatase